MGCVSLALLHPKWAELVGLSIPDAEELRTKSLDCRSVARWEITSRVQFPKTAEAVSCRPSQLETGFVR